ncbi:MAG: 50S ribosomal protein L25 [Patescibacteria group bacterium]
METIELQATKREAMGGAVGMLREEGLLPAELYGRGISNIHLSISAKDFNRVLKAAGETTIVEVVIGAEKHPVLIHDIQRDRIEGTPVHVDFYQVRLDEKIKAHIPLEFTGEAPAVKALGGVLNKSMSEIEVEALPANLPHGLKIDLSVLAELNQSIYVKDVVVPAGVKILVDPESVLVTVTEMMAEEVAPVAPVAIEDVKVESEEKKAEREKEKAAVEEK